MRIAVIGGGAIGCLIAARLSSTPARISLVVRRPDAAADIRQNGIRMATPGGRVTRTPVHVTDDPLSIGPQDLAILCVKAYALKGTLSALSALSGPDTVVMPVVNGIPWWYPAAQPAPLAGRTLASVDPGGVLSQAIDPTRLIGALTYVAVENQDDGVIRHVNDQRFVFGDPAGRATPMLSTVTDLFRQAGFDAAMTGDIRSHIWTKLWGNLAFNPLSVLTGASLATLCQDPGIRAISIRMMEEARRVADRLGVRFAMTIEERIATSAAIGDFKTSMLQDFEAGRRLELEAILASVIELAGIVGAPAPVLDTVLSLTELRARNRIAA